MSLICTSRFLNLASKSPQILTERQNLSVLMESSHETFKCEQFVVKLPLGLHLYHRKPRFKLVSLLLLMRFTADPIFSDREDCILCFIEFIQTSIWPSNARSFYNVLIPDVTGRMWFLKSKECFLSLLRWSLGLVFFALKWAQGQGWGFCFTSSPSSPYLQYHIWSLIATGRF